MKPFLKYSGNTQPQPARSGFTLTEMLVAVGLLLVIMTIFAQIFQLAVTAMTRQKGLANNDQRARTAFSVIDADLKRMSYRSIPGQGGIVPLVPGLRYNDNYAAPEQQGYFYYSENNPNDDADDVLQFTVDASLVGVAKGANRYAGQSQIPFYGKAATLNPSQARDQPDWDDGTLDGVSTSRWAEVSYFLRHGTLYRRVMLIRDTDDGTPRNMQEFDQGNSRKLAQPGFPQSLTNPTPPPANKMYAIDMMRSDLGSFGYTPYSGNFYTDFDFSAHYGISPYDGDLPTPTGQNVAVFHGSLSNEPEHWPLGIPHFRFGFGVHNGRPREFAGTDFFGRFTHEETSHPDFGYPRNNGAFPFTGTLTVNQDRRITQFPNGSRRGADILLNNVQSFNVEIWDTTANRFVSIGSSNAVDFANSRNLNNGYGASNGTAIAGTGGQGRNIFDTWHSVYDIRTTPFNLPNTAIINTESSPGSNDGGQPPFVPKKNSASSTETGLTWRGNWAANTNYNVGDLVIPSINYTTLHPGSQHDRINEAIIYRCVVAGRSVSNPTFQNWPRNITVGQFPDGEPGGVTDMGQPKAEWIPIDNRAPIKAIRLTIRFLDTTSQQIRQVTMVHSFNEDGI